MIDGPAGGAEAAAGKCYWSQWKDDRGGGWRNGGCTSGSPGACPVQPGR